MRLSPLDPLTFLAQGAIGFAHFVAGRYDEALSWAQRAVREQPNFAPAIRIFAASCELAGHQEQAEKAFARMRQLDSAVRVSDIKDRTPLRRAEDLARYKGALRRAGLPEWSTIALRKYGDIRLQSAIPNWRATVDEDGQYSFAVALWGWSLQRASIGNAATADDFALRLVM